VRAGWALALLSALALALLAPVLACAAFGPDSAGGPPPMHDEYTDHPIFTKYTPDAGPG
jgi:hypothetical protein